MKVAFIGQKGFPSTWGGVEVHVHNLAVGLAARSHDIAVFNRRWYASNPGHGRDAGVRVIDTPCLRTKHLDALSHAFTSSLVSSASKFDIVHFHCMGPSAMSWLPRIVGKRVVATVHGFDYSASKWGFLAGSALRFGEWAALHVPHATVVVAKHTRDHYRRLGWNPVLIPNGVAAVPHVPLEAVPAEWGLAPQRYLLLLARLEENKGPHQLIEAFNRCRALAAFPGQKLVIAGEGAFETRYVQRLRLEAGTDVLFTGTVTGDVKHALLGNATAFVSPSTFEGMPIALLEAMSASLPIVASDIPAHRELLRHDVDALLFDCARADGLTAALLAFSRLDADARAGLGSAAKAAARTYTWQRAVDELERLYRRVLELPPGERIS